MLVSKVWIREERKTLRRNLILNDDDVNSRRLFIQRCFSALLLSAGISCASEDKKESQANPCDYSTLSEEDVKKRRSLGFVEKAPTENKHCGNCNLYFPAKNSDECGRCQLFNGPVTADAYCTYWAPQV
jgi:hypothetical protein